MVNAYGAVILATLLASWALHLAAGLLNLRAAGQGLPDEFAGVYDAAEYARSQRYLGVNTRFGFVESTFGLAVLLAFWFAGGFQRLDALVRGWGLRAVPAGLVFIGLLVVARALLMLPFSVYDTFVIEARFGFNRTTARTFVLDLVKMAVLGAVIGGPILAAVLALLEYAGPRAWLYCWGAATAFSLILIYVAPAWIMPLFNRFTPLEDGELRRAILECARKAGFPVSGVFVMDGSKRSSKSNAFFTGFGRTKRICLFDTLIARHTVPELVAVLAHEIGHYKKGHILKGVVVSVAHTGVLFYLLSVFISERGLFEAFHVREPSVYAGLVLFGMLFSPVEFILAVAVNVLSRRHEYEADRFAVETVGEPEALVSALKKLSADNLSNLTPHPVCVFLEYSHPPVLARIRAIRRVH